MQLCKSRKQSTDRLSRLPKAAVGLCKRRPVNGKIEDERRQLQTQKRGRRRNIPPGSVELEQSANMKTTSRIPPLLYRNDSSPEHANRGSNFALIDEPNILGILRRCCTGAGWWYKRSVTGQLEMAHRKNAAAQVDSETKVHNTSLERG
jgi:hypothetical protein